MSTMIVVLHLLVGHGAKRHWQQVYVWRSVPTQSMLCEKHAQGILEEAHPGARQRVTIRCRKEMSEA